MHQKTQKPNLILTHPLSKQTFEMVATNHSQKCKYFFLAKITKTYCDTYPHFSVIYVTTENSRRDLHDLLWEDEFKQIDEQSDHSPRWEKYDF